MTPLAREMTRIEAAGATGGMPHRLVWLDGLRGIAATAVVFGHFVWSSLRFPGRDLFDPGVWGVCVFFLISGFIVPQSVRPDRSRPLARFVSSRVFRLYPAYWFSLAVGVAAFGAGTAHVLINMTMLQRFVGVPDVIGVYWTLQIEALFYGLIALTLVIGRFNDPRLVCGGAVASALVAVGLGAGRFCLAYRTPIAVPIGLSVILCGNALALVRAGDLSLRTAGRLWAVVATLLAVAFGLGYSHDWGYRENPTRFLISYGLAVGAFAAASRRPGRTLPLCASLGAISYPIYLLHQPLHDLLARAEPAAPPPLVSALAVVAVLVLAIVVHRAIEQPAIRLGRRVWRGRPTGRADQWPRKRSAIGAWLSSPTSTVPPSTLPISTGSRKLTT